jgi:hypothetical protein
MSTTCIDIQQDLSTNFAKPSEALLHQGVCSEVLVYLMIFEKSLWCIEVVTKLSSNKELSSTTESEVRTLELKDAFKVLTFDVLSHFTLLTLLGNMQQ